MKTPPTFLEVVLLNIIFACCLLWLYLYNQDTEAEPHFLTLEQAAAAHYAAARSLQ